METQEQLLVQKEIRRLKKTVEAMRAVLEKAEATFQIKIQKAVPGAGQESVHLKKTIVTLRGNLEELGFEKQKAV